MTTSRVDLVRISHLENDVAALQRELYALRELLDKATATSASLPQAFRNNRKSNLDQRSL